MYPQLVRVLVEVVYKPGEAPDCLTPDGGPARRLQGSLILIMVFRLFIVSSWSQISGGVHIPAW
jgi:hypothetical protein